MIDIPAQALLVGAVIAAVDYLAVLSYRGALVKADTVACQRVDKPLGGTGDLTLRVGVLYAEIKHAARLVRKPFAHHGLIYTADVNEPRGAGRKTRDLGPLRQVARRIFFLQLLGSHRDIRKEQLC